MPYLTLDSLRDSLTDSSPSATEALSAYMGAHQVNILSRKSDTEETLSAGRHGKSKYATATRKRTRPSGDDGEREPKRSRLTEAVSRMEEVARDSAKEAHKSTLKRTLSLASFAHMPEPKKAKKED